MKLAWLIKSFLAMPNTLLLFGIGHEMKVSHERGATRGGCTTRGGSLMRGKGDG
jgi:hypothetical protein